MFEAFDTSLRWSLFFPWLVFRVKMAILLKSGMKGLLAIDALDVSVA